MINTINDLLLVLDEDASAVPADLTYDDGPLKGVLVADFVRCAANLVRMRTGRDPK